MKDAAVKHILQGLTAAVLIDLMLVLGYLVWCDARVQEPPAGSHFDAGVVFFSGFEGLNALNHEARSRVDHAATLFHRGSVAQLITIGGRRHHPERSGAALMAERLRAQGVPQQRLRVDRHSFDTLTNWQQAVRILSAEGWSRPLLISGPLHLARIRTVARQPFEVALSPSRGVWQKLADEPWRSWAGVHVEWAAWAAMALLPADTHRLLVERWRNFWD